MLASDPSRHENKFSSLAVSETDGCTIEAIIHRENQIRKSKYNVAISDLTGLYARLNPVVWTAQIELKSQLAWS